MLRLLERVRDRWSPARQRTAAWWAAQEPVGRIATLGGAGIVLGVLVGAGVVVSGSSGGSAAPPSPSATPTVTEAANRPSPVLAPVVGYRYFDDDGPGDPDPVPTEDPIPTYRDLGSFVEAAGEPPGSGFARLRIPALGVNTGVGTRSVGGDGYMPLPAGPADAVWYDLSAWPSLGGTPGGGGNAIFSGHVDYSDIVPYAGVRYRGSGVFFSLDQLSPGDIIEVDVDGVTLTYAVDWRRDVDASSANWSEIFSGSVARDSITLVTCGGEFDFTSRSYASRTVVRAVRI